MKYKLNQLVREGGCKGPISKIIAFCTDDQSYVVQSLDGMAIGRINEDMLYPYKDYEQLSLF